MLDRAVTTTIIRDAFQGSGRQAAKSKQPDRRSYLSFENRGVEAVRLSRLREPGQEGNRALLQHPLLRPGPGPAGAPASPGPARPDRAPGPSALDDLSASSR